MDGVYSLQIPMPHSVVVTVGTSSGSVLVKTLSLSPPELQMTCSGFTLYAFIEGCIYSFFILLLFEPQKKQN